MSSKQPRTIIAGGGRVGRRTANILSDRGYDVIVIEPNSDRAQTIADDYVATVIEGDATRPTILEQVGLERVDVIAALTAETGTNLAICLAATRMVPEVKTILRTDVETRGEYDDWVDEVVFPENAAARVAANTVESDVRAIEDTTSDLDLLEITVAPEAPVAERTLEEVGLPRGCLVVSSTGGNRIAGPETELIPDETYTLAVEPSVSDEVLQLFRG
jgi:trk system potassium uptake protein TrkA